MADNYTLDGDNYTQEDVLEAAEAKGLTIEDYINKYYPDGSAENQLPDNRSWVSQAWDAGGVNADLYDNADAIFDITSSTEAKALSDDELNTYINLLNKSEASAAEMQDLNEFTTAFQKYNDEGENFLMSSWMAMKETGNAKGFAQAAIQSYRSMANEELLKESAPLALTAAGGGAAAGAPGGPLGMLAGGLTSGSTALVASCLLYTSPSPRD